MTDPFAPSSFTPSSGEPATGPGGVTSIPAVNITPRTTASLASAIAGSSDPISVQRRWATVLVVNGDGTVDINLGGVTVTGISRDANYYPVVGDVVRVDVVATDLIVVGPTAPSGRPAVADRVGTITAVAVSGTAPGTPTTVTVNFTDSPAGAVSGIPFISSYFPTVGDTVHVQQVGTTYLVMGAVGRTQRRPTGDIEPTVLAVAKANTLILDGSAVSRTTYAALWAWAQINGLVKTGLFTTGNGTTTFGLPDFRGRVPVGAGTLGSDTYTVGQLSGSSTVTLATAQMPAHNHSVSATTNSVGNHAHSGTSGTMNSNWNHNHSTLINTNNIYVGTGGPNTYGVDTAGSYPTGVTDTNHTHDFGTNTTGAHTHTVTVTQSTIGGTTPVDVRQPSIGVNWLIWI
jgi:microcystin-dependent protein